MSALATLAKLVGVPTRLAEDALHSERAAKYTLTRRGMLGAVAAMASGAAFGFPEESSVYRIRLYQNIIYTFPVGSWHWEVLGSEMVGETIKTTLVGSPLDRVPEHIQQGIRFAMHQPTGKPETIQWPTDIKWVER